MGFRYRKSVKLPLGFRVNFSKSGVGYSWGTKGYRKTVTANGKVRTTYSIPGTGISYVDEKSANQTNKKNSHTKELSQDYNNAASIENYEKISEAPETSQTSKKNNALWIILTVVLFGLSILFIVDKTNTTESTSSKSTSQTIPVEETRETTSRVMATNNLQNKVSNETVLSETSDLPESEPIIASTNKAILDTEHEIIDDLITDTAIIDLIDSDVVPTAGNTDSVIATSQSSIITDDIVLTDKVVDLDNDTITAIKDIFSNTSGADRTEALQKLSDLYSNRT